jgi:hypothetical protein
LSCAHAKKTVATGCTVQRTKKVTCTNIDLLWRTKMKRIGAAIYLS